jgi:hypothetical protein
MVFWRVELDSNQRNIKLDQTAQILHATSDLKLLGKTINCYTRVFIFKLVENLVSQHQNKADNNANASPNFKMASVSFHPMQPIV